MNVTDKYPLLIGYSPAGRTSLHSLQDVADFICTQGLYDDLLITTADGEPFISNFGTVLLQFFPRISERCGRQA